MENSFLVFFVFIGAAIGTFVGRTVAANWKSKKDIKSLEKIIDTEITNKKKKTLGDGTAVYFSTIKRTKPLPATELKKHQQIN